MSGAGWKEAGDVTRRFGTINVGGHVMDVRRGILRSSRVSGSPALAAGEGTAASGSPEGGIVTALSVPSGRATGGRCVDAIGGACGSPVAAETAASGGRRSSKDAWPCKVSSEVMRIDGRSRVAAETPAGGGGGRGSSKEATFWPCKVSAEPIDGARISRTAAGTPVSGGGTCGSSKTATCGAWRLSAKAIAGPCKSRVASETPASGWGA